MTFRSILLAAPLFALVAGCSPPAPAANSGAVAFHGQQTAFPAFMLDTGFQPANSPVQVKIVVSAAGGDTIDALAVRGGSPSAPTLTGSAGSGRFAMDVHFRFQVLLKVNIPGPLGHGIMYEGPLMNAPNIDFGFGGQATFDPFLVGGNAPIMANVPETMLVTIPLTGAVPIPGVTGTLTISIAGVVNSSFSGVCAAISPSGDVQYTGTTTSSGNLMLRPTVHIAVASLSRTLDPFAIPVMIPSVTLPVTLAAQAPGAGDAGPVMTNTNGSMAQSGTCGPAGDGGTQDGTTGGDATADDVPASDGAPTTGRYHHCAADGECSDVGAGARCLTFYPGGLCTVPCMTSAECGAGSVCYNGTCRPGCELGQTQCDRYSAMCGPADATGSTTACFASCFPSGRAMPAGFAACAASAPCDPYQNVCTAMTSSGGDVGAPCTRAEDCRGSGCLLETGSDGTATGFIGGYCLGSGRQPAFSDYNPGQPLPTSNCPPGSAPYPAGGEGDQANCLRTCTSAADCRNGYACTNLQFVMGMASSNGFCLPVDCSMAGMTCPTGYHCVTMGADAGMPYGVCSR